MLTTLLSEVYWVLFWVWGLTFLVLCGLLFQILFVIRDEGFDFDLLYQILIRFHNGSAWLADHRQLYIDFSQNLAHSLAIEQLQSPPEELQEGNPEQLKRNGYNLIIPKMA